MFGGCESWLAANSMAGHIYSLYRGRLIYAAEGHRRKTYIHVVGFISIPEVEQSIFNRLNHENLTEDWKLIKMSFSITLVWKILSLDSSKFHYIQV